MGPSPAVSVVAARLQAVTGWRPRVGNPDVAPSPVTRLLTINGDSAAWAQGPPSSSAALQARCACSSGEKTEAAFHSRGCRPQACVDLCVSSAAVGRTSAPSRRLIRSIRSLPDPRVARLDADRSPRSLGAAPAENDLDAPHEAGRRRRDDNWKKLSAVRIFDEREQLEMRGPSRVPIWGEKREYTWYIRGTGFFVRSPTKFKRRRDRRRRAAEEGSRPISQAGAGARQTCRTRRQRDARQTPASPSTAEAGSGSPGRPRELAQDVGSVIRQKPTAAVHLVGTTFLRFKFEEGKYAPRRPRNLRRPWERCWHRVLPGADVRRNRPPA